MIRSRLLLAVTAALAVAAALTSVDASAQELPVPLPSNSAPPGAVTSELRFTTSDGVELQATLRGEGPLTARPVIVEFSPYGPGTATLDPGPAYNSLLVEIRGTGRSDGRFDALGPRTQQDVVEVLDWACRQEWSNGQLGLNGFSASAIAVYNSLHQALPCVRGAVLKSGTHELYRDLLYPGGVQNLVPIAAVLGAIGATTGAQAVDRLDDPATIADVLAGQLNNVVEGRQHPTQDEFWLERGFRGDVSDLPILMVAGFYDVESRGAFEAFQELRDDGAHLLVAGAHDGVPAGTDGGVEASRQWLDRWVRGIDNGAEDQPPVRMLVGDGGYEELQAGRFVTVDAADWPVPGTRWLSLGLDPTHSGTSTSMNDGTLVAGDPTAPAATHDYPAAPSFTGATDPYNTSNAGASGAFLWNMALVEPVGLAWTSDPFTTDVISVGPASLEVRLSSTAPETAIWVTLSDVAPDGTARPVAAGRLLNSFPDVNESRSRHDPTTGDTVQPYGVFHPKTPVPAGEDRLYQVEIWPIGNRFAAGHRLRVHVTGVSALYLPSIPAINTVTDGAGSGSRLLFPVLEAGEVAVLEPARGDSAAGGAATPVAAPAAARSLPATGGTSLALLLGAVALFTSIGIRAALASPRRRRTVCTKELA